MNHTQAFKCFGTKPTNVRSSWSARSAETVVITLWQDQIKRRGSKMIYEESLKQDNRFGGREMMKHLAYAWDYCDRKVNVIIAIPKDPTAHPRSIKECFPSKIVMRLTHFDPETSTFAAEAELH